MKQIQKLDIQFRLSGNKKWIKPEVVRIAKDNGLSLAQLMTMILDSWLEGKRGKKVKILL